MSLTHSVLRATLSAVIAAASLGAHAQAGAPAYDEEQLRAFVSEQVAGAGGAVTRFDVQIGKLNAHMVLAPCKRVQPFVPAGMRLWGRSTLGVRCADGASWSVLLPVTVSAWGPALVAAAPLAAGAVLSASDIQPQEVELTRQAPGFATDVAQLEGQTLVRSVQPGQPLRTDMVRATPVIRAGDPVRLRIQGTGFSITAAGQAMAQAAEGQTLRVRTDLGKVLTGVAREGRVVDVAL